MAQGKVAAALITAMKGAQMGPPIFSAMPRWLAERLTSGFMASEDRKGTGGYLTMRALAPTMHYDFQLVLEMNGRLTSFAALVPEVLLLGGSKSPAYLRAALDELEHVVAGARRAEFPGLDHAPRGIEIEVASRNRSHGSCDDSSRGPNGSDDQLVDWPERPDARRSRWHDDPRHGQPAQAYLSLPPGIVDLSM